MKKPLHIVIIGAGNLAHHLARSFKSNPALQLIQIFNHRWSKSAIAFAEDNACELIKEYQKINTQAHLYLVCVKDDALPEVAKNLSALKLQGMVLHTSGSMDLSVLKNVSKQTGVYYPLQTFSAGSVIDWKTTPILIEASTTTSLNLLKGIASSVSDTVKAVDSVTRLKLHLSAVFACNFTNALCAAAFDFIETHLSKKDTALLKPLMKETFLKLDKLTPKQAQTGPAMRKDTVVMKKHLQLLKSDKQLTAVYKLLSDLIIKQQY